MAQSLSLIEFPSGKEEGLKYQLMGQDGSIGELHLGSSENSSDSHIVLEIDPGFTVETIQDVFSGGETILRIYVKRK